MIGLKYPLQMQMQSFSRFISPRPVGLCYVTGGACGGWPLVVAQELAGKLEYTTTSGEKVQRVRAALFQHVFNHGTHHRGQVRSKRIYICACTHPRTSAPHIYAHHSELQLPYPLFNPRMLTNIAGFRGHQPVRGAVPSPGSERISA